jgi:hypothetical protein
MADVTESLFDYFGVSELRDNLLADREQIEGLTRMMPPEVAQPYFELIDREIASLESLVRDVDAAREAFVAWCEGHSVIWFEPDKTLAERLATAFGVELKWGLDESEDDRDPESGHDPSKRFPEDLP